VDFIVAEPVSGAEVVDAGDDPPPLLAQARELGIAA
jgi:hypothetical protein